MSAYIVENETIDRIVTGLARLNNNCYPEISMLTSFRVGRSVGRIADCTKLGKELLAMNTDAVNLRYPGTQDTAPAYKFNSSSAWQLKLIQFYKSLQCFLYQCTEGKEIETRKLFIELTEIKNNIARAIVNALPEYQDANWG